MKIYSCPKDVPPPVLDFSNYNHEKALAEEGAHKVNLEKWLRNNGYNGKYTGKIYSEPVADGSALYMIADGPKSFLIHLPYGDGYTSLNVQYIPKKEIIRRIERYL